MNVRVSQMMIAIALCLTMLAGCVPEQNNSETGVNSMSFSDLLQPMQKNSIRIGYNKNVDAKVPLGASKIGGNPDLPPDFEWFYFEGESFDGVTVNRPLSFLAQINCEEASRYDKDSTLPTKGMLYFFYELATMTWGFDPSDKGSASVYYFSGEVSELQQTDFPSDLRDEYKIPEMPIAFSSENELPDYEEFLQLHEAFNYDEWERYDNAKGEIVRITEENNISKLLGYANLVQGGMLLECELTASGVNTGSPKGYANVTEQQKENLCKWQLLFQLDSIVTDEYEMLWGDLGRIYFYINIDDLKALNFDNCWLILQCG